MNDERYRVEERLRRALERLRTTLNTIDPHASEAYLSDALARIDALNDLHRRRLRKPYEAARDTDPMGCTVRGLVFARNFDLHDAIEARSRKGGMSIPTSIPAGFRAYLAWRPRSELPSPKRPDPDGEAAYDACLAGRDAYGSVNNAAQWLIGVAWPP